MRVFLKTFGCTLNQSDSDLIRALLQEKGFSLAENEASAQAIIVNSCGVKESTEKRVLSYIEKIARSSPRKKLVVCGCLPKISFARVRGAAPDAAILGPNNLFAVVKALEQKNSFVDLSGSAREKTMLRKKIVFEGAIARVPIAFGCLGECAYCGVRQARGVLYSVPLEQIVCEVRRAVAGGAREIRLTAQDAGCWGFDLKPRNSLAELLRALNKVDGKFFIRVGMINPRHALADLSNLVDAFEGGKIFKFLHLPVQSGSDEVLAAMNRGYCIADFKRVVRAFQRRIPGITLATDLIIGFPTESRAEFEETLSLLEEVKPCVVNVSKYGARPGLPASALKQIDNKEVKERSIEASGLARELALQKNLALVGREFEVVFVEEGKPETIVGRTQFYKPVVVEKGEAQLREFARVKIIEAHQTWLKGLVTASNLKRLL